jgi:aldose 1-epimerase
MMEALQADWREPEYAVRRRVLGRKHAGAQSERGRTTLSNAYLSLDVESGKCGGIAQFDWNDRGNRTSVFQRMDGRSRGPNAEALACRPLIRVQAMEAMPWGAAPPLRKGRARHSDAGPAWTASDVPDAENWRLESIAKDAVRLTSVREGYYLARQTYTLDGPTLDIAVELANMGEMPLQCGIDLCSTLVRDPDTYISAPASGVWIAGRSGLTPRLVPTPSAWQFGVAYPLPATKLDHVFTGWGGRTLVEWPTRQFSLAIVGDTDCYRLHAAPGETSFAFQVVNEGPASEACADARGLAMLETGESLTRRVSFTVERLGAPAKARSPSIGLSR